MRQIMERFRDAWNERDRAALVELFAPDVHWVDRRLVSWGEGSGRDGLTETWRGLFDLAPDLTLSKAEMLASGESAYVTRHIYRGHSEIGGGEVEFGFAILTCVADGQIAYFEMFPDTSVGDALARFEEIGAQTEPERLLARGCRAVNSRDWEAIEDRYTEDFELIDHRLLGWEPMRGGDAMVKFYRSWVELAPDIEVRFETLAGDDEHAALRFGGYGHAAEGGGEMEYSNTQAVSFSDGRVRRVEIFEFGDEARALARFHELRADRR